MKILAVTANCPAHNKACGEALYNKESEARPVLCARPDSALLKGGKPFFVPDWCERVEYGACVAVRVCRLGKSIPERFAHRYYDALTLCVSFRAADVLSRLRSEGLPWDEATGFDSSTVIGEWVDKAAFGDLRALDFALMADGVEVQHGSTAGLAWDIDAIIAHTSRLFTLKMGDIILTGEPPAPAEARPGLRLTGTIGGRDVLAFNCK